MPLDPDIQALLGDGGDDDGPAFSLGVAESRAAEYDFIELCGPEEPVASVVDRSGRRSTAARSACASTRPRAPARFRASSTSTAAAGSPAT